MKTKIAFIVIIIIFTNCCKTVQDNTLKSSYRVINLTDYEDCNIYTMVFVPETDYLFRYALSGSCKNLDLNECLHLYNSLFEDSNLELYDCNGKKIIIELYNYTNEVKDSLVKITERQLNRKVKISKEWKGGFEVRIQ
ncbi:hypothetical protein [Flavobacterium sp.]|uniref:hypothetical protein n=1 Tax=Flavobacterium sp. TaxID=239 RepID=UPI00261541FB|nr:hypothetical protein [Flavobacterium sp.]